MFLFVCALVLVFGESVTCFSCGSLVWVGCLGLGILVLGCLWLACYCVCW